MAKAPPIGEAGRAGGEAGRNVAPAVVDPKAVQAQLLSAQGQIAAGNLDAGLKSLAEVRAKAGPALAPRIAFVEKLVAVRVADRLGDQAKVSAGLAEALKQAGQPDQLAACWQLGLNLAQAAVAAKSPAATGLIDILAAQARPGPAAVRPAPGSGQLRIAAASPAAAEAELSHRGRADRLPGRTARPGPRPSPIWPKWSTAARPRRPASISSSACGGGRAVARPDGPRCCRRPRAAEPRAVAAVPGGAQAGEDR